MREIAAEYRLSHWAGVIQERNASGMSIKGYCESIDIRPNVYFYWQRKLREAACETLLPAIQEKPSKDIVPAELVDHSAPLTQAPLAGRAAMSVCSPMPPGWAVVCESEPAARPSSQDKSVVYIEIGKSRIPANHDMDPELLAKVCRVLIELC